MKYKITVKYDGSNFHGWAKQKNLRTVQNEIEKNLEKIYKQPIIIEGSGRTDAYVHSIGQVFSFSEKKISINKKILIKALNTLTSDDIEYTKIEEADSGFHARFCAKNKTYKYVINTGNKEIFSDRYLWNYCKKIDIKKAKSASKLFLGEHDFLSFSTTKVEDTKRKINWIKISQNKNLITIRINGNGFLRNMVRMIVGNIIDINENKKTANTITELLSNPKKGSSISKAPGCGLYLEKVNYLTVSKKS